MLWQPPAGRGRCETIVLDPVEHDQVLTLIDDAFNANPASLDAALEVLAASTPVNGLGRLETGRRIAILGDMLELGEDEIALHEQFADHHTLERITTVHCVGPRMRSLWVRLPVDKQGIWVENAPGLVGNVHGLIDPGDVVLVKGSKGSKVSILVDAIRNLGHRQGGNEDKTQGTA
jgi:UDP-N-acetylmuramoyl-tripeptide--D-alanyl-D-alanine ligase